MSVVHLPARDDERLRPVVARTQALGLARERHLPVLDGLTGLLPEGGLVRGRVVRCAGDAAVSAALALAAGPTRAGSWAGFVGLPGVGLLAAAELGMAIERVILVAEPEPRSWGPVLAALADGVDVVVAAVPARLRAGEARRLQARVQARGGVLVVLHEPGPFVPDLTLTARTQRWEGVGTTGAGRLERRRVALEVDGRRVGRPRRREVWLPGSDGTLAPVNAADGAGHDETGGLVLSSAG